MGQRSKTILRLLIFCALPLIVAAVLVAQSSSQTLPPVPPEENIDWFLVIDTSKSMRGVGGTEEIFNRVKEVIINDFINRANKGDTVSIIAFGDNPPDVTPSVSLSNDLSRTDLINKVKNLKADALKTYTGDAVSAALERIKGLRASYKDQNRKPALLLFTDGYEDHAPQQPSIYLRDIPVSKIKAASAYTYVVWLNTKESPPAELGNFVEKSDRGRLVTYTPAEISNIFQDFKSAVLPPQISMNPTQLPHLEVEPGNAYEESVTFMCQNKNTSLKATLRDGGSNGITLAEPSGPINLERGQPSTVRVRLQTPSDLAAGEYTGTVVFTVDELTSQEKSVEQYRSEFPVTFSFKAVPVSPWVKVARWALRIVIALAVILVAVFAYRRWRRANYYLQGELFIVAPDGSTNGSVRLREVTTEKVRLSELQGGRFKETLGDMDAELKAIHEIGDKRVQINAIEGPLYVRDTEVSSLTLADGDIIKLGDLKLKYSGGPAHVSEEVS
jgi:hypothetical protein